MFVAEKNKVTLNLPQEIDAEFDRLADTVNGKQKWAVASAAILVLSQIDPEVRQWIFALLASADMQQDFSEVLKLAKDGRLLKKGENRVKMTRKASQQLQRESGKKM